MECNKKKMETYDQKNVEVIMEDSCSSFRAHIILVSSRSGGTNRVIKC